MYQVKGFKTEQEAKNFKKVNGGIVLCHAVSGKTGKPTQLGKEYQIAIQATGLDPEQNPYIVEWRV